VFLVDPEHYRNAQVEFSTSGDMY